MSSGAVTTDNVFLQPSGVTCSETVWTAVMKRDVVCYSKSFMNHSPNTFTFWDFTDRLVFFWICTWCALAWQYVGLMSNVFICQIVIICVTATENSATMLYFCSYILVLKPILSMEALVGTFMIQFGRIIW